MQTGVDRLLRSPELKDSLRGRRVALLGHPASVTAKLEHSLDALLAAGVQVVAAFGPQHGILGEQQDNMMETADAFDERRGLPVHSLYGTVRRPTPAMMQGWDVLLVDLQDLGTRIYTFVTTLLYVMQACAEHGKEIWVLDRPNPIGRPIDGGRLRPGWTSFVGAAEGLPMQHGLTMGELALWYEERFSLRLTGRIVRMAGYDPDQPEEWGWPSGRAWVNPSPNAPNLNMARVYPGSVLLEGTHFSEGRGTTRPLEMMGRPEWPVPQVLAWLRRHAPQWLEGCVIRETFFLPTFHKFKGELVSGVHVHADGPWYRHGAFRPYRLFAGLLKASRKLNPGADPLQTLFRDFHYEYETSRLAIDIIDGGPGLREWILDEAATSKDLDARLDADGRAWEADRAPHLIYGVNPTRAASRLRGLLIH